MKTKCIVGTTLLICGIALIGFSTYVSRQVEEGKGKVNSAQSKVDKGKGMLPNDPITKELGKGLTRGVQKKIDAGKEQITYYEGVASWSKIGGIACIMVGLGVFFIPSKKGRR